MFYHIRALPLIFKIRSIFGPIWLPICFYVVFEKAGFSRFSKSKRPSNLHRFFRIYLFSIWVPPSPPTWGHLGNPKDLKSPQMAPKHRDGAPQLRFRCCFKRLSSRLFCVSKTSNLRPSCEPEVILGAKTV